MPRAYSPRMSVEQRREQLLDAALAIIGRDGYAAVSVDAIAREAGVTRPVVYRVFDDANALLFALLDRQEQRALTRLLEAISLEPDLANLDAYLGRAVADLLAMVEDDPATWRAILFAPSGPAAVRERVDRDRELVRERVQLIIEVGLATNTKAPAGLNTGVLAHMVIAMAEHFGRLMLETPEAVDPDQLTSTISALLTSVQR